MKKLLLVVAFIPALLFSQSRKERKALEAQQKADQVVIANLKSHIQNLTAGKSPATNNSAESNATEYISNQFKLLGLQPKGTVGFVQPFAVDDGKKIETSTYLKVNDALLVLKKEYFPLPYSAEKKVTGMPAMALRERGVPWFADLKDWLEDGAGTAGFKIEDVIKKETAKLAAKGASALFLYNSGSTADGIAYDQKDKSSPLLIPVIYITKEGYKKYFSDHSQMLDIELNVAFKTSIIKGSNVLGFIDNSAPSTIVIGAHYIPAMNNLKSEQAEKISAGADENASGVALLIELARTLSASKAKGNNYLFIALGGNDQGTTACNYFLANSTVTAPVNYVLNVDMVGSYDESKKLFVQGYTTTPVWKEVFTAISDKKLEMSIDSSAIATGPQASFYNKEIPVLSFSSANHSTYSLATDDESKINYAGELQIAKFLNRLIETTDSKGKIAFTKVNIQNSAVIDNVKPAATPSAVASAKTPLSKTSVSLGVIPDKTVNENGLKISGITPNKLASKIGLQSGDVLTYLGSHKISDLNSYLEALTNFKVGDKTSLKIKRGKEDKEFALEF